MKIAYIVFDGITWLDMFGVYDAITRLKSGKYIPDIEWEFCCFSTPVKDLYGLEMVPWKKANTLNNYNAIIVPGGHGTRKLIQDENFLNWIRTAENVEYKISICTGSLILGAAGFLKSKRATTNYLEYETLKPFCGEVVRERIVEDGNIITAGAVAASLDLGLYLCEKWASHEAVKEIQKKMNYH
ncbi:MAG: DJ-1/PfpI family protein [Chitinophagaceae bacterium]|nr:DJ-1/PfpI family protein [Chitinophagaceae bacterium]